MILKKSKSEERENLIIFSMAKCGKCNGKVCQWWIGEFICINSKCEWFLELRKLKFKLFKKTTI